MIDQGIDTGKILLQTKKISDVFILEKKLLQAEGS